MLTGAAAFVALLYFFAPDQHAFYPRCLFYVWTGLQCPGCGGLRAAHSLLHGNVALALEYNALFVLFPPLLAGLTAFYACCKRAGRPWHTALPLLLCLLLAVVLVFVVWRNI